MLKYDLIIASDHAGFDLKAAIIKKLRANKMTLKDLGTNGLASVDYPDYARRLVEELANDTAPFGILICGTGIGMSIAANRFSSARAALCTSAEMATLSRQHNDANILILGGRITTVGNAFAIIENFLKAQFEGEGMLAESQNYTKKQTHQNYAQASARTIAAFCYSPMLMLLSLIVLSSIPAIASEKDSRLNNKTEFPAQCQKDINYIKKAIEKHAAGYKNKKDQAFQKWFKQGLEEAQELARHSKDQDDCFYAAKYLLAGFDDNRIAVRSLIQLPKEQYPGLLTALIGGKHQVIYKNNNLLYLKKIKLGDELISLNDEAIQDYFAEYIEPFYANNSSVIERKAASIYCLIVDGNSYRPVARKAKFRRNDEAEFEVSLRYTDIDKLAHNAIDQHAKPQIGSKLKVDSFTGGVWIRIPSFYPTGEELILLKGVLSSLQDLGTTQDYIVFDVRGNLGGKRQWPIAIMRNLYGDHYIKSLGKNHSYNTDWRYDYRLSKDNFLNFKLLNSQSDIKAYAAALTKKQNYYRKNYKIWQEKEYLFTNKHKDKINAKIIVVTDNFCSGSCWSFVHAIKQMPNVLHVGLPTNKENRYFYHRPLRAPSKNFEFYLPAALISNDLAPYNTALVPNYLYHDNINKDLRVIEWVLNNFRK